MASRSLNQVELIGNLTRDPELRYTPNNTPVCTFSVATNRQWVTESGEKKEDAEFHRIVAWQKLAEICGKYLVKGRRVWIRGRLQTRSWTGQDGANRQVTEIVLEDMIMLDSRTTQETERVTQPASVAPVVSVAKKPKKEEKKKVVPVESATSAPAMEQDIKEEEIPPEDIPF